MTLVESFSGIRGIYGENLTDTVATRYAHAYITFLKEVSNKENPTIVIGRDTRHSGPQILKAITIHSRADFIDVGIAPTPAVEHAVRYLQADGGIIITASHNEPEYNGFKFLNKTGAVLNEQDAATVIHNYKTGKASEIQNKTQEIKQYNITGNYKEFVLGILGEENIQCIQQSNQTVLIDPNGGAGTIAKEILETVGVNVITKNMQHGEFNRTIEPTQDSLDYLKDALKQTNAAFAAGFDCDADRVEIMTASGELISGNHILALIVHEALSITENPEQQTIVVNDATSNIVRDTAQKFQARVHEVEVGETNVVEKIKECNALLGGEGSNGGVIIPPSTCRDGILTLLFTLATIAKQQKPLQEIITDLPRHHNLKTKVQCNPKKHDAVKIYLKNHFTQKGHAIQETGDITGGLKVRPTEDSYLWFRASKTEPSTFRIIADAPTHKEASTLLNEGTTTLKQAEQHP